MYPITTLLASVLTLLYVYLAIKVIKLRKQHKVSIGGQGLKDLEMTIRAHGNFAEYVPFGLILFLCAESNFINQKILMLLAFIFLVGRTCHAHAFLYETHHFKLRSIGMIATFLCFLCLALLNLWRIL